MIICALYGFWIVPRLVEGLGLDEVVKGGGLGLQRSVSRVWGSSSQREKATGSHGASPRLGPAEGAEGSSKFWATLLPRRVGAKAMARDAEKVQGIGDPHWKLWLTPQLQGVGAHGKLP